MGVSSCVRFQLLATALALATTVQGESSAARAGRREPRTDRSGAGQSTSGPSTSSRTSSSTVSSSAASSGTPASSSAAAPTYSAATGTAYSNATAAQLAPYLPGYIYNLTEEVYLLSSPLSVQARAHKVSALGVSPFRRTCRLVSGSATRRLSSVLRQSAPPPPLMLLATCELSTCSVDSAPSVD